MIFQVFLEVHSDTSILEVNQLGEFAVGDHLVGELADMKARWAEHPSGDGGDMMVGTRIVRGHKILYWIIDLDYEDPLTYLNGLIALYEQDWKIHGLYSLTEQPVRDADGNPVPTGETDEFGAPIYEPDALVVDLALGADFDEFLADTLTGDPPVPTRPTRPVHLHRAHSVGVVLT